MNFYNKVVIVTGASSGIGKACALQFAKLSAKLTLVGRDENNLKQVKDDCEKLCGMKPLYVIADISNENDISCISRETINRYGKIDVLVNNAGILLKGGVMDSITNFDKMSATNIRGTYLMTQAVLPHLIKTKGNIVNVSSTASTSPLPTMTSYCMTKAAIDMLTKCVALDVGPKGVRVNSVNPGPANTALLLRSNLELDEVTNNQVFDKMGTSTPLRRLVELDDVANIVVFLASDSASSITGSSYLIDCGVQLGTPIL